MAPKSMSGPACSDDSSCLGCPGWSASGDELKLASSEQTASNIRFPALY